jgi:maltose alpha-D-glucosyltransferase/alpha-amylase
MVLEPSLLGKRIRCHGNYHLEQLLFTGKDFVIADFEGDPARPIGERRIKRSALRDIASMIRSLDYAVLSVLLGLSDVRSPAPGLVRPEDRPTLEPWAHWWHGSVSHEFLAAYVDTIGSEGLLPGSDEAIRDLLERLLLEKSLSEIGAELTDRPEWVEIPLRGALRLLGYDPAPALQI